MNRLEVAWRRRLVGALVLATVAATGTAMALLLADDGFGLLDLAMLACFLVTVPWVALGFWNSLIGFLLLQLSRRPLAAVAPYLDRVRDDQPITTRTAVVMPVRNEDPARVFRHLRALRDGLDATGEDAAFDYYLLSDSDRPEVVAEEERRFSALRSGDPRPERLTYRRRADNAGRKVGNLRDFLARWGAAYDFLVVLDADSVMTGPAVLRLVRCMQANPRIGILQSLVVGLPSSSAFTRLFQFGMRQAMRPFTVGSAWWQADQGPYWGHNAILRRAAYEAHCRLPVLPGGPPFGGEVLSHDQVEAVLMRRAGYEVRVLPLEDGSFEENPPTLPDFIKRECRWCQGNLQYLRLLGLPGIRPLGRVQLIAAILMYVSAPAWLGFIALGLVQGFAGAFGVASAGTAAAAEAGPALLAAPAFGFDALALLYVMLGLTFAPRLLGVADLLLRRSARAAYGGAGRLLAGAGLETLFSVLLGPVMALALTRFIAGLLAGRSLGWDAQRRDGHALSWREALRGLWPQTLAALVAGGALLAVLPGVLPWAAPVLLGLGLAVPFAVATSRRGPGALLRRAGLCATPEELGASGGLPDLDAPLPGDGEAPIPFRPRRRAA